MKSKINIQNYKMVISDLDGTIKGEQQPIHPFTIKVIKRLYTNNIHFTIASGRNLASLRNYAEQLGVHIPMVLNNGGLIQSLDGKIYHRVSIPLEMVNRTIEITDQEGVDMVAFCNDRIYCKKITNNISNVYGSLDDSIFEIGSWRAIEPILDQIDKFMIIDWNSVDNLEKLKNIFDNELNGQVDYFFSNIFHLDVMPRNVTKATGLKKLGKILDISMEEIIAFGDFDNDAEMLKEAGIGVAVANSSELAKSNSDIIVGSCTENGPAFFLNDLLS